MADVELGIISIDISKKKGVILIAGDATVVTKSGKSTHALGKFYSSIYSRAVPAISFQCLSLICVNTRKSWPIMMEQMTPKAKKSNVITTKTSPKRGKGRPKGSKNKIASDLVLNAEMTQVQGMLKTLISNKDRSCEQREPRLNPIVGQARAFISAIYSKYLNRGTSCLNTLFVTFFSGRVFPQSHMLASAIC